MGRNGLENRTSPDPRERPAQAKMRGIVFAFVVVIATVVLGVVLVVGPVSDALGEQQPVALYVVPALIGLALVATLAWFLVQARRGRGG